MYPPQCLDVVRKPLIDYRSLGLCIFHSFDQYLLCIQSVLSQSVTSVQKKVGPHSKAAVWGVAQQPLTCIPSRHIPHSKGSGSSKWHLQWLSRVCRCRRQSQTRSFFQRCPVQTYTHSCYPAQQQTPLPGQSSGYEVEQMSAENKKATFHLTISELPVSPTRE